LKDYEHRVGHLFDKMEEDYDEIRDLWYAWLFSRLHWLIATEVLTRLKPDSNVLDLGCGTGFQSFLFAAAGARVTGIDLSERLIHVAQEKCKLFVACEPLFEEHFPFTEKYNATIRQILDERPEHAVTAPEFRVGSALNTGVQDASIDVVNCCGSVMSFIDDHEACIAEIARVLRPGGLFILEVEAKYNLDLLWPVLDALTGGFLGYESSLSEALEPWRTPIRVPVTVEFPFGETSDPVYMRIKLFSKRGLKRDISAAGLKPERWFSIHSLTNFIPSTILDTSEPSPRLRKTFSALAWAEERIPFRVPGASLVVVGSKAVR
jgi:ubiquinone/menaquinone biosynthesis C-methylase UbiE